MQKKPIMNINMYKMGRRGACKTLSNTLLLKLWSSRLWWQVVMW